VMVVAEQDRVDMADLPDRDGRAGKLAVDYGAMSALILPRRIKGGIGEKTKSVILDENGRPSDQRQGKAPGHAWLPNAR